MVKKINMEHTPATFNEELNELTRQYVAAEGETESIEVMSNFFRNLFVDLSASQGTENKLYTGDNIARFIGSNQADEFHNGFATDFFHPTWDQGFDELNDHLMAANSTRTFLIKKVGEENIPHNIEDYIDLVTAELVTPGGNIMASSVRTGAGNDVFNQLGGGSAIFDGGEGNDVYRQNYMTAHESDTGPAVIVIVNTENLDIEDAPEYVAYWAKINNEGEIDIEDFIALKGVESMIYTDKSGTQHSVGLNSEPGEVSQIFRVSNGTIVVLPFAPPLQGAPEEKNADNNEKAAPAQEGADGAERAAPAKGEAEAAEKALKAKIDIIQQDALVKLAKEKIDDDLIKAMDEENGALKGKVEKLVEEAKKLKNLEKAIDQAEQIQPDDNGPKKPGEVGNPENGNNKEPGLNQP